MKKHLATIALGAMTTMGVAGLCWAQAQSGDQPGQMSGQQQQPQTGGQTGMSGQTGQTGQTGGMGGQTGGMAGGQTGGMTGGQQIDQNQVRQELSRIAQAALSNDPTGQLGGFLKSDQRDRITQIDDQKRKDLQNTIQAFKNDWRTRYNQDFDLSNAQQVAMSNYQILPGGLGGAAQPAGGTMTPGQPGQQQWQQRQQPGDMTGQPRSDIGTSGQQDNTGIGGSARIGDTGISGTGQVGDTGVSGQVGMGDQSGQLGRNGQTDQNGQFGQSGQTDLSGSAQPAAGTMQPAGQQNQATVVIPADRQHNLPQVTLTLVQENGQWRLNLPQNIDGNQLSQNLKDHLFVLGQQKNQWPQDVNQGYTLAAHHVFAALQGMPAQGGAGGMQPQGMQQGQQPGMSPSGDVGSRTGEQSGIGAESGQQGQPGQTGGQTGQ